MPKRFNSVLYLKFVNWCLLVICYLFIGISESYTQDTLNSKTVEERSYSLCQEKKWNELIEFGDLAVKNNFDYYYLRLRIGIAYYEKKNYRAAQKHFWKAYQFNSSDDVLNEYLYYCYIYNAQYYEARKFSKTLSPVLAQKLKTDSLSLIDFLMLEGGAKTTSKSSLSNAFYGQIGLGHRLGKNVSFFHAVTLFNQKGGMNDLDQKQYYIASAIPVKKSWLVTPAFHFLNTTKAITNVWFKKDTLWPPGMPHVPPPPWAPPLRVDSTPMATTRSVRANYFIASMEIKKSISKLDVGICGTVSNIDSINQAQGNLFISYFPLGNPKLSFTSNGFVQREDGKNIPVDNRYAFSQSVAVTIFKKINLSGSYLYNEAHHFNELNGYLANNSNDLTTSRFSFMGTMYLSRHINFYLIYQLENKELGNPKQKTSTYTYNNFFGGIKFIL